jgi:hypothetical protein
LHSDEVGAVLAHAIQQCLVINRKVAPDEEYFPQFFKMRQMSFEIRLLEQKLVTEPRNPK